MGIFNVFVLSQCLPSKVCNLHLYTIQQFNRSEEFWVHCVVLVCWLSISLDRVFGKMQIIRYSFKILKHILKVIDDESPVIIFLCGQSVLSAHSNTVIASVLVIFGHWSAIILILITSLNALQKIPQPRAALWKCCLLAYTSVTFATAAVRSVEILWPPQYFYGYMYPSSHICHGGRMAHF